VSDRPQALRRPRRLRREPDPRTLEEHTRSYRNMNSAAAMATVGEKATVGAEWGAALHFGGGAATSASKAWPAIALLA
jgi:hypothetical protein